MRELFRLKVVAKRQVTIPQRLMDILGLSQGDELHIHVSGGQVWLQPYRVTEKDQVSSEETALMDRADLERSEGKFKTGSIEDFVGEVQAAQPELRFRPTTLEEAPEFTNYERVAFLENPRRKRGMSLFERRRFELRGRPRFETGEWDWYPASRGLESCFELPTCVAPRNFRRDDRQIYDSVGQALAGLGMDVSDVEVHVNDGVVQLTGTTPDRQQRLLAEDVASRILGVQDVKNNIEVRDKRTENTV